MLSSSNSETAMHLLFWISCFASINSTGRLMQSAAITLSSLRYQAATMSGFDVWANSLTTIPLSTCRHCVGSQFSVGYNAEAESPGWAGLMRSFALGALRAREVSGEHRLQSRQSRNHLSRQSLSSPKKPKTGLPSLPGGALKSSGF